MVDDLTVSKIKSGNFIVVLIRKFKISDVDVLLHTFLMNRLWKNGHAALYIPFQSNLGCRLSVFCANLTQHRMIENPMPSFRKRPPRLRHTTVFFHLRNCLVLRIERMQFNLVYHRFYIYDFCKLRKFAAVEV